MTWPDDLKLDLQFANARVGREVRAPPTPPEDLDEESAREWYEKWRKTDEGKAYQKARSEHDAAMVDSDGGFTIEDLRPNNYSVHVQILKGQYDFNNPVATGQVKFDVPEGGELSEGVEIGELMLKRVVPPIAVGEEAPAVEVQTLAGETIKLSDDRGKVVLLDFWATWCGPCMAETSNLKSVWEEYGEHPEFVFIGLSLDKQRAPAEKYVKKNELGWIQGFLGDWGEDSVTKRYGVRSIPTMFLIDPDGRILADKLRGGTIKSAVDNGLAQGEGLPPLLVFATTGVDTLRRLVSEGAVHTATVPRDDASDKAPSRKASAKDIVELRFETLTR